MQIGITSNNSKLGIDNDKATIDQIKLKLAEECLEVQKEEEPLSLLYEALDVAEMSLVLIDQLCKRYGLEFEQELKTHNKKLTDRGWKSDKIITFKVHHNWR